MKRLPRLGHRDFSLKANQAGQLWQITAVGAFGHCRSFATLGRKKSTWREPVVGFESKKV
jgi:hypothetical protein